MDIEPGSYIRTNLLGNIGRVTDTQGDWILCQLETGYELWIHESNLTPTEEPMFARRVTKKRK